MNCDWKYLITTNASACIIFIIFNLRLGSWVRLLKSIDKNLNSLEFVCLCFTACHKKPEYIRSRTSFVLHFCGYYLYAFILGPYIKVNYTFLILDLPKVMIAGKTFQFIQLAYSNWKYKFLCCFLRKIHPSLQWNFGQKIYILDTKAQYL